MSFADMHQIRIETIVWLFLMHVGNNDNNNNNVSFVEWKATGCLCTWRDGTSTAHKGELAKRTCPLRLWCVVWETRVPLLSGPERAHRC